MLKTDFICILTSGYTVDGREVSAKTVEEMAESYNPEIYNARINIEHNQYGSKLGSVLSLKAEDFGDKKKLFAELKPNDFFLYLNQGGQKLHTSVEFVPNFAKTGKAYLTGLAVTDSPASLGTTEIKLSINGQNAETFSTGEVIEPVNKPIFSLKNPFKEDNGMDKAAMELMTQMQDQLAQITTSVQGLTDKVSQLTAKPTEENPKEEPKGEESQSVPESEELTAIKQQLTELTTELSEAKKQIEKIGNETDEVFRHQATGGSDQDKDQEVIL